MAERVVSEFKAIIEPLIERLDAIIHFAKFVKPPFVHKPDGRYLFLLKVARSLAVISLICAPVIEFALAAGRSSMVMAIWRCGEFSRLESKPEEGKQLRE